MSALPAKSLLPLPEEKSAEIRRLLEGLDANALWWLSGYAAALAAGAGVRPASTEPVATPAATPQARDSKPQDRLTIVYGSQTGNAKRVAERLAADAEGAGLAVRLLRADAYPQRELRNERLLTIVISTQGDGDPPDDARGLVEFLAGARAPALPDLKYAVLGLGDSSYAQFCAIGRKIDARLAELGATRLVAAGEADLDIDTVTTPWLAQTLGSVRELLKAGAPRAATVTPLRSAAPAAPSEWSRERPFVAQVLANQRITARDGTRDVRHLELSIEGSGFASEPGDALGVWATNPPWLVDAVLEATRLNGDTHVTQGSQSLPLRDWLLHKRELTRLARPFVAAHAGRSGAPGLERLLAPDRNTELALLLRNAQVIDLLKTYPAEWSADELVAALRPLAPRLYSIASSRALVGDEIHLTVASLERETADGPRVGVASDFLATRAEGDTVPVFLEPNERFRLPADSGRDIVMIGPGTGVAPFRGFVQERSATAAAGRNWLFFGNPHFDSDFLYQVEWQAALKQGALHRLDLAFSRDQAEKVYVQHRLRERGRELFDWIENGAHLYVCGDATAMAKDVHEALVDIVSAHGSRDRDKAREYIESLQQQGRYARDVY